MIDGKHDRQGLVPKQQQPKYQLAKILTDQNFNRPKYQLTSISTDQNIY